MPLITSGKIYKPNYTLPALSVFGCPSILKSKDETKVTNQNENSKKRKASATLSPGLFTKGFM